LVFFCFAALNASAEKASVAAIAMTIRANQRNLRTFHTSRPYDFARIITPGTFVSGPFLPDKRWSAMSLMEMDTTGQVSVEVDSSRCRVRVTVRGALTLTDMCARMDRQAAAGQWRYGVLNDLREVTTLPETSDFRRLLAHARALSAVHGPGGPIAVVTTNDALYGMARVFSTLAQATALTVGVFRTIEEAEGWVDDLMTAEVRYYSPNEHAHPPRSPRPVEAVWTLERGSDCQVAQLQSPDGGFIELRITFNGTSYYTRSHETRDLALREASGFLCELERDGWTHR